MNAHAALAVFLILEHRKGEDSEFYNYLHGLPPSMVTSLMNWPDEYDPFLMTHMARV